ncbi:uncharacterized protein EDB91DRAFT_1254581 [Suillus paluster]|uniref:uncharacterized protein n=1 Tax=Suillus paluster TaxID=48578 RepID=UPI001B86FB6C|nr:uncharacterized protein EDB91DRAFT_1254581 [Suillus paluster]KAG1725896.1 hypothetical protein EDB91DRAFT_1254581 [Suillus paluster]
MELPSHPSASRGRGKARGCGSNPPHNQAPKTTAPRIIVHWTRPSDLRGTDTLVQHLVTHPLDAHIIFYKGKKSATSSNEECPSGKDKGEIYQVLVKLIFTNNSEYSGAYAEHSKKFDIVKSFKEQLDNFNKTGAGVTLLDENAAVNLHNPQLAPPDPRLATPDPQLAPPLPQLTPPLPLPQLIPPLPQLALQSPHAASAQPDPASTLYPPPSSLHQRWGQSDRQSGR